MNRKFLNSFIVILILIISVGCGFLYDALFTRHRLREYPRQYNDTVIACYYEYGVPVSIIYADVKIASDYNSGLVSDDGRIGLMQITRDEYDILAAELGIATDSGLLFEPKTNLNIGTYKLSKLYEKYGIKTVFDPVRAYRSMWKFTKSFNMLKDVLFAYQIADIESSVKNPFMPMMGSLDYPEIIKTLAKINEDNKERYAVMIADNVFNRFSQFSSEGLSSSLDELLFKMGKIIVGERE